MTSNINIVCFIFWHYHDGISQNVRIVRCLENNFWETINVATSTFDGINKDTQVSGVTTQIASLMSRPDFKQKIQKTHRKIVKWEPRELALTSKNLDSKIKLVQIPYQIPYP
jgi:hypothetical protein